MLRRVEGLENLKIGVTGRKFRKLLALSSISEPEAVELAYGHILPPGNPYRVIVSAGGETFMAYHLDRYGRIENIHTGNKCASGTGEFFLQQLRRMDVSLEEAARWAATETPYHVSGRCSVFCKSDCTHATNKGIPKSKVTAGLCLMMANKILELLKKIPRRDIMLTGGTARNQMMVQYLQKEIDNLIVPEQAPYFEALGAALWALEHPTQPFPGSDRLLKSEASSFNRLPPLEKALRIAIDIARSLEAVHAAGFIHRNINPANTVIHPASGKLKIIDFALATRAAADPP